MPNHSIIAALEPFARFGRPITRPFVEPEILPIVAQPNLVAAFDQIRSLGTVQRGSRIELTIRMPLPSLSAISNVSMVCFTKPGPHRSNGRVGSRGPITFWEFGAIQAADAQLTGVQSQSLAMIAGGLRAGGSGDRGWFFDRRNVGAFDVATLLEFPPKTGTVVEQIDHEGEVDGIVGLPLGPSA